MLESAAAATTLPASGLGKAHCFPGGRAVNNSSGPEHVPIKESRKSIAPVDFVRKNAFVHKDSQHEPIAVAAGETLSEQAYQRIRSSVIGGDHGPGVKLKVDALRAAYRYSSSPLREALNRLAQEGLVEAEDRRGFRVAQISSEDLADLTHMRLVIEVSALRLAIKFGGECWEDSVVAAAHRLECAEARLGEGPVVLDETWSRVHRNFHIGLLAGCPSKRQLALCESLFDQAERYRRFSARHRVGSRSKNREHKRLLDAVLKRNADAACSLLAEHIQSTRRSVDAALTRMRAASG